MLIPAVPVRSNATVKANCAGQGCPHTRGCRRFQARIGEEWRQGTGQWASFDVERAMFGDCPAFVRWIGDRRAA